MRRANRSSRASNDGESSGGHCEPQPQQIETGNTTHAHADGTRSLARSCRWQLQEYDDFRWRMHSFVQEGAGRGQMVDKCRTSPAQPSQDCLHVAERARHPGAVVGASCHRREAPPRHHAAARAAAARCAAAAASRARDSTQFGSSGTACTRGAPILRACACRRASFAAQPPAKQWTLRAHAPLLSTKRRRRGDESFAPTYASGVEGRLLAASYVSVCYHCCQLGNNLYHYIYARMLAHELQVPLVALEGPFCKQARRPLSRLLQEARQVPLLIRCYALGAASFALPASAAVERAGETTGIATRRRDGAHWVRAACMCSRDVRRGLVSCPLTLVIARMAGHDHPFRDLDAGKSVVAIRVKDPSAVDSECCAYLVDMECQRQRETQKSDVCVVVTEDQFFQYGCVQVQFGYARKPSSGDTCIGLGCL
eukprot:scaffold2325_cov374-Prasinococcus_capsulatus_cf.AAC.7